VPLTSHRVGNCATLPIVSTITPGGARCFAIASRARSTWACIDGRGVAGGAKITIQSEVVAFVTEVLSESEVGFPKGPVSSQRTGRPSRFTSSLRIPGYDSPGFPRRSVTFPRIFPTS